jgi:hypothetical protein
MQQHICACPSSKQGGISSQDGAPVCRSSCGLPVPMCSDLTPASDPASNNTVQYSSVVGWEVTSLPRGSIGPMGTSCCCSPAQQHFVSMLVACCWQRSSRNRRVCRVVEPALQPRPTAASGSCCCCLKQSGSRQPILLPSWKAQWPVAFHPPSPSGRPPAAATSC